MKTNPLIWIIDNEPLFTNGMCRLLKEKGLKQITEFNSPQTALEELKSSTDIPELVLLDINMPEISGIELAKILKMDFPMIKVVGLSSYKSEILIANMLDAGAVAFLPKDSELNHLYDSIDHVLEYGFYYSSDVLRVINSRILHSKGTNKSQYDENFLTKREKEILLLICLQKKTTEIAEKLFISERTVEGHRNNLIQKTNSVNSIGLITYAFRAGIIDLDYIDLNMTE